MSDLIEFLRARLDEDGRGARAADTHRRWVAITDGGFGPQVRVGEGDIDDDGPEWSREINVQMWQCEDEADGCPDEARGWLAEGQHIARHDPARVLADVDAKRAILALRNAMADLAAKNPDLRSLAGSLAAYDSTLKWLAMPYADHPDYREEWRP